MKIRIKDERKICGHLPDNPDITKCWICGFEVPEECESCGKLTNHLGENCPHTICIGNACECCGMDFS